MSRAGHRGDIRVIDLRGDSGDEAEECSNAVLCPICYEHLPNEGPVATICGHLFCFKGLRNWVRISSAFPLCR
ncbi:GL26011 [Drosophila persimilis]|uniref:GL26011 n=1 Tax=Drosophila persimilis TaxID=7234 RepID=B4GK49_DROPE|nr:GL26011 [Drosophila persimilis]